MERSTVFILCMMCVTPIAQAASQFDIPLGKKQLNLPPTQNPPPGEPYTPGEATDYRRISCFYFDRYMVKEINLCVQSDCSGKDEGAYRLSVLPLSKSLSKPLCQMESDPNEMAIPATGHFMGAKGDYFFFVESPDSGEGIDVFSGKTGKKCFHALTLKTIPLDKPIDCSATP